MSQFNCLNCSLCQLQPDTDFTQKGTVIWCNAERGERRGTGVEIEIRMTGEPIGRKMVNLKGCPQAVPVQSNSFGPRWTEVATKALADLAPLEIRVEKIGKFLGRPKQSCYAHARRQGIHLSTPWRQAQRANHLAPHRTLPRTWTPGQVAYLKTIYQDAEQWPIQIGGGVQPQNPGRKAAIMKRLAEMGPPHSWEGVMKFARLHIAPNAAKSLEKDRATNRRYVRRHRQSQGVAP